MRPKDLTKLKGLESKEDKIYLTDEQINKVISYRDLLRENRKKGSRITDELQYLIAEQEKLRGDLFDALEKELGFEVESINWEEGYITK